MAKTLEKTSDATFNIERADAFDGLVQQMDIYPKKPYNNLEDYIRDLTKFLEDECNKLLNVKRALSCWMTVEVNYIHLDKEGNEKKKSTLYFNPGKFVMLSKMEVGYKL